MLTRPRPIVTKAKSTGKHIQGQGHSNKIMAKAKFKAM